MGISMKPYQFHEMFVLGNYDDFKDHPDCIRRAFNAVVSASHIADHYYVYYKDKNFEKVNNCSKIGHFVEYISGQTNGYFQDIRSISNAYKHLYTKSDPRSSISSAGTIEVVGIEDDDITEVSQDYLDHNNSSIVIYTKKSNEQCELLPVLSSVIDYWNRVFSSRE